MQDSLIPTASAEPTIPIHFVTEESFPKTVERLSSLGRAFAAANGFSGQSGRLLIAPGPEGGVEAVLHGLAPDKLERSPFLLGKLASALPPGAYRLAESVAAPTVVALGWALSAYRFDRYKVHKNFVRRLAIPEDADEADLSRIVSAIGLGRDLVNAPANDLGPAELAAAASQVAAKGGASVSVIDGERLERDFPLIHAVGRASERAPRLVDMVWGDPDAPKVTLVGKGVCYDTGGLDIKPSAGMAIMKKDMGGAAAVLALAQMVMEAELPVRLRVLVPAVENAISGSSFRTGDVIRSRKGLTVEIGNTDAEGRLILADALALADEEEPDLLIDLATLTGAARTALGPDLPPFYTDDDALAADLARHGRAVNDPLWRMPLWRPYDSFLDGKIADVSSTSSLSMAGSVIAALFLKRFVERAKAWVHFDVYAWTPRPQPGRPEGGEVQAARALYAVLKERYGAKA